MKRLCWLFIFLLNRCLLERPATAQSSFPSLPGLRRSHSPRFEGWYTRITANNGQDVIGVVTGAFVGESANCGHQSNSGSVAVMRRHVDTGELEVYEHFPQCLPVRQRGRLSQLCHKNSKATEIKWQADGIGFVTQNETCIQLPCGVSLKVVMHNRRPWNACFPWRGPEGMAEHLPCLDSHWNVYSLGSDATFFLSTPTGSWSGVGSAHQETNWGKRFPTAYVWSQGSTPDGSSCYALAGGELPLGDNSKEGWLLGFRTPDISWDFRPQVAGTTFTTQIDVDRGRFNMTAQSPLRTLKIVVAAPPSSFSPLAIPTDRGFVHETIQSFSGTALIHAYRHGPLGEYRCLVECLEVSNVALEFGGDYLADRPQLCHAVGSPSAKRALTVTSAECSNADHGQFTELKNASESACVPSLKR